jgi:hypothetical protein
VEILWKAGGSHVHKPTARSFSPFLRRDAGGSHHVSALSAALSLDRRRRSARMTRLPFFSITTDVDVHRFEETINGREFLIEVSAVGRNRWRAHLVRVPGGSTALMPFYGNTPQEAAAQLSNWLARAHGTSSPPANPARGRYPVG